MSELWNPKCPVCKTERWVNAGNAIPRIEEGMLVCVDCGCLFVALSHAKRAWLVEEMIKARRVSG